MTEESHYTADDAPEPPVPEDAEVGEGAPSDSASDSSEATGGEPSVSATREAWRDVLTQIDALGDSMGRWAKAAVNDPENRRHASEIKAKFDAVGAKISDTFDEATHTEIGRSVAEAADKTGKAIVDVSGKVAQEAAPATASVLSGLAGFLGKAAERVGQAAERPATPVEPEAAEPQAGEQPAEATASEADIESEPPGGDVPTEE